VTPLHALFQRRIEGDDALLRLAALRFEQAGLAAEVYAGSTAELEWMLEFLPWATRPPMVHLPRDLDLLDPRAEDWVARLAGIAGDRVGGFVVHDRRHLPERMPELVATAERLSTALVSSGSAMLFVEYAAGVRLEQFVAIGEALRDVGRVGVCVDIGHVGIWQARREFERRRPADGRDVTAIKVTDPDLPEVVDDVQAAVASAPDAVEELVVALASQNKPVHFHLHDGHPLVEGLSDHYGFLLRVAVPFRHGGTASLAPLFGPAGLERILRTVARTLGQDRSSFTLEIHEHGGRLPLTWAEERSLFPHWRELTHAERMNFWLRELADNAAVVRAFADR
jgi:hypothetical protein